MSNDSAVILFVANLTSNVTDEHLVDIFSNFGTVGRAFVAADSKCGHCKGYGFVEFGSLLDAQAAYVHMNGGQIDGNRIKVSVVNLSDSFEVAEEGVIDSEACDDFP